MHTISEWWMWPSFFVFIAIFLAVDLFLLGGNRAHRISTKEALGWVIIWFSLALIFNAILWWYLDSTASREIANQKALEFFTGYLIEESLSIDNMFVFFTIFSYFTVPTELQHRVLLLGVLGAIVLRLVMIMGGIWLIIKFHWMLLVFGAFLVLTGIKMLVFLHKPTDLAQNPILRYMSSHLRITKNFQQEKFLIRRNNHWFVTPLFLVLVLIEFSDLIFAVDSIPAIFAITNDPFIVFTSNIFAILGLRSLYFLVINIVNRFALLKYGLAVILIFVGIKMLIADWYKIPVSYALAVIVVVLLSCVALSLLSERRAKKK